MLLTTMSSREFNQDIAKAKRDALKGPVIITDRSHPSHVLLSIKEYQNITSKMESIVELLAMPNELEIDFEAGTLNEKLFKPADLS